MAFVYFAFPKPVVKPHRKAPRPEREGGNTLTVTIFTIFNSKCHCISVEYIKATMTWHGN